MAATKGNNFWEQRSKHGRDKIFADANTLWETFVEYCIWEEKHPWIEDKPMTVDKGIQHIKLKRRTPYTMMAFCIFCGVNTEYFIQFKRDKNKCTEDFSQVIKRIENVIYTQKFKGAASGFFNANIIARDLGLADKQVNEVLNYNTDITPDEAKAISQGLEEEF